MSCSIKRFKCDTNPEKVVNTENVKKLNNDLTKLLTERSLMDNKYFPTVQTVDPIIVPTIVSFGTTSNTIIHTKSKKE
jgi:hypothetical protein